MKTSHKIIVVGAAVLVVPALIGAQEVLYESKYEKTPVGKIEVKVVPAMITLQASDRGNHFKNRGRKFMKLFRYIQSNEVKMTVPVEVDVENNSMRFVVGTADEHKNLKATEKVSVERQPGRLVLSIGLRGSYSEANFVDGEKKLRKWLEETKEYRPLGKAYVVYWHGPYIPSVLKRSEVHIEITPFAANQK